MFFFFVILLVLFLYLATWGDRINTVIHYPLIRYGREMDNNIQHEHKSEPRILVLRYIVVNFLLLFYEHNHK